MKLKQLADVIMGHSFRTRLERVDCGDVFVIQMKDLTEDNQLNTGGLVQVDLESVKARQYVEPGDIVFRSRGQTNTAVLIAQDIGEAVIAAPLLRIRVRDKVLPAYLTWFINQPMSQAWLTSHAKGTAVRMISKQTLEGMDITVPPIERQQAIVQLTEFSTEEQRLMKELTGKRKQLMDGILMQIASNTQ